MVTPGNTGLVLIYYYSRVPLADFMTRTSELEERLGIWLIRVVTYIIYAIGETGKVFLGFNKRADKIGWIKIIPCGPLAFAR